MSWYDVVDAPGPAVAACGATAAEAQNRGSTTSGSFNWSAASRNYWHWHVVLRGGVGARLAPLNQQACRSASPPRSWRSSLPTARVIRGMLDRNPAGVLCRADVAANPSRHDCVVRSRTPCRRRSERDLRGAAPAAQPRKPERAVREPGDPPARRTSCVSSASIATRSPSTACFTDSLRGQRRRGAGGGRPPSHL